MNIRKKLVQAVVVVGLLGAVPTMAFADTAETGATGGWAEGEGYFTNSLAKATAKHKGWKEVKGKKYRAVGETDWKGTRHYTRAQMVSRVTGYVYADSGRKWGTGFTRANSPYTDNYQARSFYGR